MVNKIEIVDQEDGDDARYMVCRRLTQPMLMPDNEIGLCTRCGEAIQFRPHAPSGPPKVCVVCMLPEMERLAAKGELHATVTPKTAAEVIAYNKKKREH
jgi:hypothetical protein